MLRNYLKISWRNLIRNKTFSAINILGLALGMTCSFMIMLWVYDEWQIDRFHLNGDRLYQVYERRQYDGKVEASYLTQGLLADELKKVIPEVQYASGMESTRPVTFEAGEKITKMEGSFAGADFFKMFSYPLLQGTMETALSNPVNIAISHKMADQFFGSPEKAIGKSIRYENREDLLVTAVFENIPVNSSIQFDFLRSWSAFVKENNWVHNWNSTSPATFVQLRSHTDPVKVDAKIRDFIYRYLKKQNGSTIELGLQSYPERYLHSSFKNGQLDGGRIDYVHIFSLVAVFILLIACINFMNLSTARSAKRAKEVGIRKVVGAVRHSLIGQFLGEAFSLTLLSAIVALVLVIILLPAFNTLTGKQLFMPVKEPLFWVALMCFLTSTAVIAGSYPALFLSSLKPLQVLKGSLKFSVSSTAFRKGLVIFQFALSILLIVGMIVMHQQLNYIQNVNMGYDRENLIYIPIEGDLVAKYNLFKSEAANSPGIATISRMRQMSTIIEHHTGDIYWPGKDPNLVVSFADTPVGYDFVKTMNLELKEGRDFSKEFGTDSVSYIINETALKKIGYKNPIGQALSWGTYKGTIIGVLKDFHFNSMHDAIDPLVIRLDETPKWGTILVRTKPGKTREAIASLEKVCKTLNPKFPFIYQFSDQEYATLYKSEQIVSSLGTFFAGLAIFISCLGLFGLAAYTTETKIKEIGIRKVLGASVINIVSMLSIDFVKLVGISFLIASPIAWYVMSQWLQNYVYRIEIHWTVFALSGIIALLIALATFSFQAIKAALMNPVKSLKTE